MNARDARNGRGGVGLAAAALLVGAILAGPAASAAAGPDAPGPDLRPASWLSAAWSELGELWNGVWEPIDNWFTADGGDGSGDDDCDSTNTEGDGCFDPGGDGGFLDPDRFR